jgi:hypothetical protein
MNLRRGTEPDVASCATSTSRWLGESKFLLLCRPQICLLKGISLLDGNLVGKEWLLLQV